ncbi:hypothetical protein FIBSPDRAFT_427707 [Athelia psychrophila]|uniref:Biotin carboxylase C-terminal domain-containing protein n=1 Tax=Athelia psychrophila TaxID=1759441 RepID=A0A166MTQ9_9AGAM|nr:hypothetical protein FIBSPDRAFT_427707 [Fibularhizoctonia sp. CBS 109695]
MHEGDPARPCSFREGDVWPGVKARRGPDRRQRYWRRGPSMGTRAQRAAVIPEARRDGTLQHHPELVELLLAAATKMARALRYQGVRTFAYLVNLHTGEWVFLEIKARTLVEHGISIACRAGRGVHVDTGLCRAGVRECNVGTDFDSLLAKILVRGRDLGEATQQPVLALQEPSAGHEEGGVKTNGTVLAGVVTHAHWEEGKCDTMWLERELRDVISIGTDLLKPRVGGLGLQGQQGVEEVTATSTSASGPGSLPMRPGAIFHLVLSPPGSKAAADTKKHALTLTSIVHNTFATHLSGMLQATISPPPLAFSLKQVQSSVASVPVHSTSRTLVTAPMSRHC